MAANPFDVPIGEDICVICQHPLSEMQSYQLPECHHTYHTHCIITWFRTRPSEEDGTTGGRCPCCGDQGVNNLTRTWRWRRGMSFHRGDAHQASHFAMLRKEAKKPDGPPALRALFDKEAKAIAAVSEASAARKEYKEFLKTNTVDFYEAARKASTLRLSYHRRCRAQRDVQRALCNFPIIPVIIPMPVDINWQPQSEGVGGSSAD